MKRRNFVSQHGYSLIEVMVVLVISSILAGIAIARFGSAGNNLKRQNISRELKINLERARFDSVKRRAEVVTTGGVVTDSRAEVTLVDATSFTVRIDLNQNGKLDATDIKKINFAGQNNIKIINRGKDGTTPLFIFPVTIRFDRYGRIEARDATPKDITPLFTVSTDEAANVSAANSDVIYVSPSGTVAMLKGGESKPNFNSPNVSPIPANTQISEDIRVK